MALIRVSERSYRCGFAFVGELQKICRRLLGLWAEALGFGLIKIQPVTLDHRRNPSRHGRDHTPRGETAMDLNTFFLQQLERETAANRKVLQRVPPGKNSWGLTIARWRWDSLRQSRDTTLLFG